MVVLGHLAEPFVLDDLEEPERAGKQNESSDDGDVDDAESAPGTFRSSCLMTATPFSGGAEAPPYIPRRR